MRRSTTRITLDLARAGKTVGVPRLRTVSPKAPGGTRRRAGKGFVYLDQAGARLAEAEVERCRLLVIPPAWEQVWICPRPNGHLQAVGTDAAFRLLDLGFFRIGGEAYAEQNNSYGLATIQKQHVSIEGDNVVFDYVAKSGQERYVALADDLVRKAVRDLLRRRGGGPCPGRCGRCRSISATPRPWPASPTSTRG